MVIFKFPPPFQGKNLVFFSVIYGLIEAWLGIHLP